MREPIPLQDSCRQTRRPEAAAEALGLVWEITDVSAARL